MKVSLKAALLSGLVFPGIGHMVLRKYVRGSTLVIASLVALAAVIISAYQRALRIADRIVSGEIPMEPGAIAQAVASSTNAANTALETSAVIVLAACWLAGIIDSYRLGAEREQ